MKKYILCLLLLCKCLLHADSTYQHHQDYETLFNHNQDYLFVNASNGICVNAEMRDLGLFNKSSYTLSTVYSYSDQYGNFRGSGELSFWTLGDIFKSIATIHVKDEFDRSIGHISGTFFTFHPYKYYIQNAKKQAIAVAYFDKSNSTFKIVAYENEKAVIAQLERAVQGQSDAWNLKVFMPHMIDNRVFLVFGAFVTDNKAIFDGNHPHITEIDHSDHEVVTPCDCDDFETCSDDTDCGCDCDCCYDCLECDDDCHDHEDTYECDDDCDPDDDFSWFD